jgi:ABC-2 type transport system permease protein
MNWRRTARVYRLEAWYECIKTLRMPGTILPLILFPVGFYLFFGVAVGRRAHGGLRLADYLVGTYGAFSVVFASLTAFGVGVAVERGLGWLQLKRAGPMPLAAYFFAKTVACLLMNLLAIGGLFITAALAGGVRLPLFTWLLLTIAMVLGSIPFSALGITIGYLAGPNSAPGIVNAVYMPLAFCSGLWIPLAALPEFLRNAAPALPPYHLGQLALSILRQPSEGTMAGHVLALCGFTVLFAFTATLAYRREQGKMYG